MNRRRNLSGLVIFGLIVVGALTGLGCTSPPAEPESPAWADVAPIFRGECNGCHGWNAGQTGGGYRFDFFEVTPEVCGDAALALGTGAILAGSPTAPPKIAADILTQPGVMWPRMPPQPSPALPKWERDTIERWTEQPVGPPPAGNRPPTIAISNFPATANTELAFTAVIADPDGDSVLGVVEVNGLAFLMNRPGSFNVSFGSSAWPVGPQDVKAVLCDGWVRPTEVPLGKVQVKH
jgi:hypothetical protein